MLKTVGYFKIYVNTKGSNKNQPQTDATERTEHLMLANGQGKRKIEGQHGKFHVLKSAFNVVLSHFLVLTEGQNVYP